MIKLIFIILSLILHIKFSYINCNNDITNDSNDFLINLTENEFKDKILNINNEDIWFIKFYAPWCIHCKNLYPDIIKVSEFYKNNKNINIGKVDCTIESKLCKELNINGYPTMRLYSKGNYIKEYKRAKRSYSDIIKFIQKGIQPDIIEIENNKQIKELSSDLTNYPILIMIFNDKNQVKDYHTILQEIIKKNTFDITLAIIYSNEIKNEIFKLYNTLNHKHSENCISSCMFILGKDNYSPIININKDIDFIMNYIQQYRFPFVNIPSKSEFIEYLNSGNIVVIMGINNNIMDSYQNNQYINEFNQIAKKVRKELFLPIKFGKSEKPRGIIFAIIDFITYSSLFREFGINHFNFIQGYEIVIADGLKYYYNRSDMMKIHILFETIQLIINQDPKIPKLKAYSVFSINTIKRFLYDLNTIISNIFYKSWYHAIAVTIILCLIVAGITICICLIFFGDMAESYLLDDLVEMYEKKQAPNSSINNTSDDDNDDNNNKSPHKSTIKLSSRKHHKSNNNIQESKKQR